MSEHVVAVRLKFIDGEYAGIERDIEATRRLQGAVGDVGTVAGKASGDVARLGQAAAMSGAQMGATAAGAKAAAAGIAEAETATGGLTARVKDLIRTMSSTQGGVLGSLLGGAAAAAAPLAAVAALALVAKHALAAGDALADMETRTGLSAETLSVLGYAAKQADTDLSAVERAVKKMSSTVDDAIGGNKRLVDTFSRLGIGIGDLRSLDSEQLFLRIVSGLHGVTNSTERLALAQDVFGKGSQELLPLIRDLAENGYDKLRDRAAAAGQVISHESAAAADEFGDSVERLKLQASGLAITVGNNVVPALSQMASTLELLTERNANAFKVGDLTWIDFFTQMRPGLVAVTTGLGQILLTVVALAKTASKLEEIAVAPWTAAKNLKEIGAILDENERKLRALGDRGMDALGLSSGTPGATLNTTRGGSELADRLEKERAERKRVAEERAARAQQNALADYDRWISEARDKLETKADPLAAALAKVAADRDAAIAKIEKARQKFGKNARDWDAEIAMFQAAAEREAQQLTTLPTRQIPWLVPSTLTPGDGGMGAKLADLARQQQEEAEQARLEAIEDSVQRELEIRLAANQKWFEDQVEKNKLTLPENEKLYAAYLDWKKKKDEAAKRDAQRAMDEQVAGTDAWLKKLQDIRKQGIEPISTALIRLGEDDINVVTRGFDGLFDSIAKGQVNLSGALKGLQQDLASNWAHLFGTMVSNALRGGDSVLTQMKATWSAMDKQRGTLDGALAGAGMGGMIGGFFQQPDNNAQLGGTIGGAIGSYWGPVGAAIGSAIGTAIGTAIKKSTDYITVSLRNITLGDLQGKLSDRRGGTADTTATEDIFGEGSIFIDEKGISGTTRNELIVQVRRRVRDTMKGWQSILDLFPEEVRTMLASLKPPTIDLTGDAKDVGDISDTGALSTIEDILSNKLGKAAFSAYRSALAKGLEAMGVEGFKVDDLFERWGELQGQDLQDAVRHYVETLVSFIDIKSKIGQPFWKTLQDAQGGPGMVYAHGDKNLFALDQLNSQMAMVTASLPKLDVEDQTAAMEQLNQLASQFYDTMVQALERIDAMAKAGNESIQKQMEQFRLAGMTDQQKLDYYYQQLVNTRNQLQHAQSPEDIDRLRQQFQDYANAAFGLAGDNPQNREQLMAALADLSGIYNEKMDQAREEIQAKQEKAADTLQQAADLLLKAGERLAQPPGAVEQPGGDTTGGEQPPIYVPDTQNPLTEDAGYQLMNSVLGMQEEMAKGFAAVVAAIQQQGDRKLEVALTGDRLLDFVDVEIRDAAAGAIQTMGDLLREFPEAYNIVRPEAV